MTWSAGGSPSSTCANADTNAIAFIGGPMAVHQVVDRLAGARSAAGEQEMFVLETSGMTVAAGRLAGEQIAGMAKRKRPTAVFCVNDLLALGFLQEMTRQGLRVPQDVAIVGYDDIYFAAAAAVPLTSVGNREPCSVRPPPIY